MRTIYSTIATLLIAVFINACTNATQTADAPMTPSFDMQKARAFIDSINAKFTQQFKNGDSVVLASHYASDAQMLSAGTEPIKKADMVSAWGSMIRNAIKDSTRNFVFTTTDLTGDAQFLIETGIYEFRDDHNNTKSKGKYVVIWKQENGEWKLYRDIGL